MTISYDGDLTVSMGVSDIDASIEWYRNILNFELLYKNEEIAWGEMSTGLANVNLGLSQVETVEKGGGATPVWGVTDIVEAKASLDAAKVKQDGDIQHIPGLVKLLTFYDPDGNAMMFFENDNQ
ncbi:VOC family protein [Parasphingorhabdus sp.]|uniref:VOC family protein n=1 Tax=Parasphingorhabdus sp. TaxID=2709688 RepID=UPI003BAEE944